MNPKAGFLFRLAVTSQLADEKAAANPKDPCASRFADEVADLFAELSALPGDHQLFREWERQPWMPVAWSDGPGSGIR